GSTQDTGAPRSRRIAIREQVLVLSFFGPCTWSFLTGVRLIVRAFRFRLQISLDRRRINLDEERWCRLGARIDPTTREQLPGFQIHFIHLQPSEFPVKRAD